MHKKLFIPGPTEVRQDVLEKMATAMIGHRTTDATELQRNISDKLRQLMYTKNEILLSTSSGSGLMEGSVRSCTARRAAVFSIGAFGDRWFKMCEANGVPADKFSSELGQITAPEEVDAALATGKYDVITITHNETATGVANPLAELAAVINKYPDVIWLVDAVSSLGGDKIEVDELGIDICITSSQKCMGLPPGLAFCSVSERAYERTKDVKNRGSYFDIAELYRFIKEKPYQYPSTPSLPHMFALDYQMDRILEEGLDARFERHATMAKRVQDWAKEHFALYSDPNHLSQTVTCITNTKDFDFSEFNGKLGERGFAISNGYGALKGKTFRIAHMGDVTMQDIDELLTVIDDVVKEM
ncbi:MAG: pyridoxal-phosphate-dependent aminotransferase family protein [Fastidiosipilaceae bacterium]|nr:alanine--glyoxylate aminotransferase family protein [Clostridiaceae bacterium]